MQVIRIVKVADVDYDAYRVEIVDTQTMESLELTPEIHLTDAIEFVKCGGALIMDSCSW